MARLISSSSGEVRPCSAMSLIPLLAVPPTSQKTVPSWWVPPISGEKCGFDGVPISVERFGLVACLGHRAARGVDGFLGDADDLCLLVHRGFEGFDECVGFELLVVGFLSDAFMLVEVGAGAFDHRLGLARGAFDLVGNAAEWVAEGIALGGSASTRSASCTTKQRPGKRAKRDGIGARCCVDVIP